MFYGLVVIKVIPTGKKCNGRKNEFENFKVTLDHFLLRSEIHQQKISDLDDFIYYFEKIYIWKLCEYLDQNLV